MKPTRAQARGSLGGIQHLETSTILYGNLSIDRFQNKLKTASR